MDYNFDELENTYRESLSTFGIMRDDLLVTQDNELEACSPQQITCVVCMDVLNLLVFETYGCKHQFHIKCAEQIVLSQPKETFFECPVCKEIQGTKIGNQPDSGTMTISRSLIDVPGYSGKGAIVVEYDFPNGIQGQHNPHPGMPYYADHFPRVSYFPATQRGIKVVRLMKIAFDRRLIFTIGRSATTGMDDAIIWNSIHHKTKICDSYFGYPDSSYLARVEEELKLVGVVEADLKGATNVVNSMWFKVKH